MRPVTASRPSGPDPVATDGRKVLLVCSGGGHLAQLLRLEAWWKRHDRVWVTFEHAVDSVPAGEQVHVAHSPTTRNIPNLVRNQALAVRVMKAERPDLVVSTGAGVALPFFVVARAMGVACAYLEVYDRIDTRTLTGRLCRPLSDRFLLQWESQREAYGAGTVVGPVY